MRNLLLPKILQRVTARSASNWGKISLGSVSGAKPWEKLRLGMVGAPLNLGQPHGGVSKGPDLIRNSYFMDLVKDLGHDLQDFGDIQCPLPQNTNDRSARIQHVIEFNKKLSQLVQRVLRHNRLCITVGGDHAIGMGTVQGFTSIFPESCLIWIDAHADINTMPNSPSGNMHGMPVSFNIPELFNENLTNEALELSWFQPKLNPGRVAFIGLRSVDPAERVFLDSLNIPNFTMREVEELGIREVTRRALELINPDKTLPLHVSLDIDVLDPSEAPATGTPVPGGLTLREGLTLVEDLYQTGCLRALDLVEVNPDLSDNAGAAKTLEAANRLLLGALGYYRGTNSPLKVAMNH